jgi:hypothetical protein
MCSLSILAARHRGPTASSLGDGRIRIDYSKHTAFTSGTVKTNFGRFPLNEKLRFLTRAAVRHVVG